MQSKVILPVIHYRDAQTAVEQGVLALTAGADGVFLISHGSQDSLLFAPAADLKERFPEKLIGLNLLGSRSLEAYEKVQAAGLDALWDDAPGVRSDQVTPVADELSRRLAANPLPAIFGSVAFKYQPHDSNPGKAAELAWRLGMVPTTSGPGTGSPPSVSKVAAMREALGEHAPLAIASGMTPENVESFLPYVTHFLVATGISKDDHHFDPAKLEAFINVVRGHVAA